MGIKFIKKKKSEVAAANTSADLKTTVDKDGNVEIVSKNFTRKQRLQSGHVGAADM